MTNYNTGGSGYRNAVKSDGTIVTADPVTGYCTLTAGTWYFAFGGLVNEAPTASAQLRWAAAVASAAGITFEDCNAPLYVGGAIQGAVHVSDFEATTSLNWIPEDPTGAECEVVGTGNSSTGFVITAGGTNAGAAMLHIGNSGARRGRIKLVLSVGGDVRCNTVCKAGG